MRRLFSGLLAFGAVAACAPEQQQLALAGASLEHNEYERALALLRDLEAKWPDLRPPERAAYAYLRGMNDYRIGFRAEARHWLAIARGYERSSPGILRTAWLERTDRALEDLEAQVEAEGLDALYALPAGAPLRDPLR